VSRYPFPIPFGWYLLAPPADLTGLASEGVELTRFGHRILVQPDGVEGLTVRSVDGSRTWPCVQRGGFWFAWHHPEGLGPTWEIEDLGPFDEPPPEGSIEAETRVEVGACLQEITENGYDEAHLAHVHGTTADGVVHFAGIVDTWFLAMGTPITEERTAVHFAYRFRAPDGGPADPRVVRAYLGEIERQYRQDTVIWEHKAYLARPALTEGEAIITRFRRWYRQFYDQPADSVGGSPRTVWPPPAPTA
jgi:3-Ketosteroid 9alpha-hydroxylase C-terminal domain